MRSTLKVFSVTSIISMSITVDRGTCGSSDILLAVLGDAHSNFCLAGQGVLAIWQQNLSFGKMSHGDPLVPSSMVRVPSLLLYSTDTPDASAVMQGCVHTRKCPQTCGRAQLGLGLLPQEARSLCKQNPACSGPCMSSHS